MSLNSNNHVKHDYDRLDDQVDPRVQIELERLNSATDDINKLEVDLDEARAEFRQLLCESTYQIEALSKKVGSCIEKARPYYEARIKSKEALLETQKAAVRFERANSAHAAAKEMVYLAEEGLNAEGRTFDHAWQEMLNHATMRVNESELERTLSEAHHKRTSLAYHAAETKVQYLQKDLKRSIAKSRPYFELKAQFNKALEEQKVKVKTLEQKVSAAKANYAEALRNLEQISDEIHKLRKSAYLGMDPLGVSSLSSITSPDGTTGSSMTNQDSESTTGSPDSCISEEYLRLPEKTESPVSYLFPTIGGPYKKLQDVRSGEVSPLNEDDECGEEGGVTSDEAWYTANTPKFTSDDQWSEISLTPDDGRVRTLATNDPNQTPNKSHPSKSTKEGLSQWISRSSAKENHQRRQSLDTFISGGLATGEKVKEILSQGIMKLNISSLTERRNSEPKFLKKAPSPLGKTMHYLQPEEDSASDCESLASVEMLTDDQIASLMLEQDLEDSFNDIFTEIKPKLPK